MVTRVNSELAGLSQIFRLSIISLITAKAVGGSTPITRAVVKRLKPPNHSLRLDVSSADSAVFLFG